MAKSVLVTGATGGIGEVAVRRLDELGWRVFAGVRSLEAGERVAAAGSRIVDTRVACDGPQALAMTAERCPDLVILDIMLPGLDGLEVMRRLHEQPSPRPAVILLTAKGEEPDRIMGLRRGADDYVVKPFSPAELVARVQAVLRRNTPEADGAQPVELDGLRMDPGARTLLARGEEIALTPREFDLLHFLVRHPGQVFSRDQLMELVWHLSYYTDSSTVTVHIRRLRAKIEPDPENPRFIQTVWGVGYRMQP